MQVIVYYHTSVLGIDEGLDVGGREVEPGVNFVQRRQL